MVRSSVSGVKKQQQAMEPSVLSPQGPAIVMPPDMSVKPCALGIGMGSMESLSSNRSTATSSSTGSRGGASAGRIAHDAQTVRLSSPRHSQTYKTTTTRSGNGRLWTSEQDEVLREAVLRLGGSSTTCPDSWVAVCEVVSASGEFVAEDCRVRWSEIKDQAVKGPWSPHEDALLSSLVSRFGPKPKKWSFIASHIPGRAGKQCRERWLNHLDTTVKKGEWTEDEDRVLCEAQRQIGNKWSEIARLLPGRAENSVKNRFNSLITRRMARASGKPGAEDDGMIDPLFLMLPGPPGGPASAFLDVLPPTSSKPNTSAKGRGKAAKGKKPAAKARANNSNSLGGLKPPAMADPPVLEPAPKEAVELLSDTEIDSLLDSLESSSEGVGGVLSSSSSSFLSESFPVEPIANHHHPTAPAAGSTALPQAPLPFSGGGLLSAHVGRPGLGGAIGSSSSNAPLLLPPGLALSLGHHQQLHPAPHPSLPQHHMLCPLPPPPPSFTSAVFGHTPSIIRNPSNSSKQGAKAANRSKAAGGSSSSSSSSSSKSKAKQQQKPVLTLAPPPETLVAGFVHHDHPPHDLPLTSSSPPSASSASTLLAHQHPPPQSSSSFYQLSLSMGSEEWSLIDPLISEEAVPGLAGLADSFYSSTASSAPGGASLDGSMSSGLSSLLPDTFADLGLDCFALPPHPRHNHHHHDAEQASGSNVAQPHFMLEPPSGVMISNKRSHGVMMKGDEEAMMSSSGSSQITLPAFESVEGGNGESSSKRVK